MAKAAGPTTVYDLLKKQATKEQIHALLKLHKDKSEKHKKEILLSGVKEDLVEHLRSAVAHNLIDVELVYDLLRDSEENGHQHIYYYTPRTTRVQALCSEGTNVAGRLFGDEWDHDFPRFERNTETYDWADFRYSFNKRKSDWVAKIYGLEQADVLQNEERDNKGNLTKYYKREEIQTVCLVRWHDDPDYLEVRIDSQASNSKKLEERLKKIWDMMKPAMTENDFIRMDFASARRSLVVSRAKNSTVYTINDLHIIDSVSGNTLIRPHTIEEAIDEAEERREAIDGYFKKKVAKCPLLALTWKSEPTKGVLEHDLRVVCGGRNSNEVAILSRTTAGAVDYVASQLRHFGK